MRRGMFIAGVVVLVVGILLVLTSIAVQSVPTSVTIPAGSALSLTPQGIGGGSFSMTWSGGGSSTQVYLITGTPTCSGPQGIVAKGTGATGSFSATMSGGHTYEVYGCNGTAPQSISVNYLATGISILAILGIIVAVIGLILGFLGYRGKPKQTPTEPVA